MSKGKDFSKISIQTLREIVFNHKAGEVFCLGISCEVCPFSTMVCDEVNREERYKAFEGELQRRLLAPLELDTSVSVREFAEVHAGEAVSIDGYTGIVSGSYISSLGNEIILTDVDNSHSTTCNHSWGKGVEIVIPWEGVKTYKWFDYPTIIKTAVQKKITIIGSWYDR